MAIFRPANELPDKPHLGRAHVLAMLACMRPQELDQLGSAVESVKDFGRCGPCRAGQSTVRGCEIEGGIKRGYHGELRLLSSTFLLSVAPNERCKCVRYICSILTLRYMLVCL